MFSFQDENQVSVMDTKSPSFAETWGVLEKLVESGKCKNIGLSNFNIAQVIFVMWLVEYVQYDSINKSKMFHNVLVVQYL